MPSREETLLSSTHKKMTAETVNKKRAIRGKYSGKAVFFQVRVSKYGAYNADTRTVFTHLEKNGFSAILSTYGSFFIDRFRRHFFMRAAQ